MTVRPVHGKVEEAVDELEVVRLVVVLTDQGPGTLNGERTIPGADDSRGGPRTRQDDAEGAGRAGVPRGGQGASDRRGDFAAEVEARGQRVVHPVRPEIPGCPGRPVDRGGGS